MDDKKKQLKTGFLDPLMISQARYKEVVQRYGKEYKDLYDDEFEKAVTQNQRKEMKVMAAYIGRAMYNHVQHGKDLIIAPQVLDMVLNYKLWQS
jgi:hypothetical protein